jgi:hypothetical protein
MSHRITKATNWEEFITDNPKRNALDEKWDIITNELINHGHDQESNFNKLTKSPSLILLTQDPFGKIQATFAHDWIGDNIADEKMSAVALIGFGTKATPVRFNLSNKVFGATKKIEVPSVSTFAEIEEGDNIQ